MIANEYRVVFGVMEMFKNELSWRLPNSVNILQMIVALKWVNYMVCELNEVVRPF